MLYLAMKNRFVNPQRVCPSERELRKKTIANLRAQKYHQSRLPGKMLPVGSAVLTNVRRWKEGRILSRSLAIGLKDLRMPLLFPLKNIDIPQRN
jgi:hypothetical protein